MPRVQLVPRGRYARRSHVVVERAVRVYRRTWLIIVSGFFEPLFYLLALGTGLRDLVGTVTGPDGRQLTYTAFIAPALLASSAMNGAVYDSTMNVFYKLRYAKLYDAMLATSLGPLDVALGEITWALLRGGLYAFGFVVVMGAMGLISSVWAVAMLPACLLVAFAFAAVGMAATSFMKTWQDLDMVQVAILPMFLFSGTFYALDVYPHWLQVTVECLPLHHAIALLRGLNVGAVDWAMLGHCVYFLVLAAAGTVVAARRLDALLLR